MNLNSTQYNLSLNQIVISAFLVLSLGVAAGSYGQKIYSQKTQASGCFKENNDVTFYAQHLSDVLKGGGKITQRQINTMLNFIEIRDSCEVQWSSWSLTT